MKNSRPYRKFNFLPKKMEELEQKNNSFKRILSEYECLSEELWTMQNKEDASITDDLLESYLSQKNYLEDTIEVLLNSENIQ